MYAVSVFVLSGHVDMYTSLLYTDHCN